VELRVVATAGHVDHGKSSLIRSLTGMEPDRWEEEKRRGLTIDLGYAWCALPGGQEIGFVDVPGHERFISNMLAGVGPVRLVLFVVAADEGWKPQSEEHLQIIDVLGAAGGVIALTKADLVDETRLQETTAQVRLKTEGTVLESSPIVPVSARTGEGMDRLAAELAAMIAVAEPPAESRTRLFVDRVFTIKGAGTVATGTLTGSCLNYGDEVRLYPSQASARIRSLQTHKESQSRACPVTRVAANLAGLEREELRRGDVLGLADEWLPTLEFDAVLRPVRGGPTPIKTRGAFKVYAGSAEADAKIRMLGSPEPGGEVFARIRTARPLILDVFDRFVVRDAGRRETVAGGQVLDVAPPKKAGRAAHGRLRARADASRDELPGLLTAERGAVRAQDALLLTGSATPAAVSVGGWFVTQDLKDAADLAVLAMVATHHREHPMEQGIEQAGVIAKMMSAIGPRIPSSDHDLADLLLQDLVNRQLVARTGSAVHLLQHSVELDPTSDRLEGLLAAIGGSNETTPPTMSELATAGFDRDFVEAAARTGLVVRVPPDFVFTRDFMDAAEQTVRDAGPEGITVSAFRQALGTSRKYAVPLMEWFDQKGLTRRQGDVRFARDG
jgi:selenocysteine-specific elongation factor